LFMRDPSYGVSFLMTGQIADFGRDLDIWWTEARRGT